MVKSLSGCRSIVKDAKAHDETERGCNKSSAIKDISLQDDLESCVQTRVDKKIVRTSELVDASADEFTRDNGKIEAIGTEENSDGVKLQETVRRNQFEKETNFGQIKEFIVSSCTNQRSKSASSYADLFMGGCGPGASKNFKSSTNLDLSNVRGQKFKASNGHDQQRGISARDKIFAIKAEVRQYRPRDSGGQRN